MNLFQKYYLVTLTDKTRGSSYNETRGIFIGRNPVEAVRKALAQRKDKVLWDIKKL